MAPLPAPRHRGQTPAPQNTPHHGCMGLRACIRPGRKRRRRRKAQPLAAPPVPTLGPHQEGAGVTSLSPQESGGRGGGEAMSGTSRRECFVCNRVFFPQDFQDLLMVPPGYPPTCHRAP